MAITFRCDGCGTEYERGRWLRVRIEPFYPQVNNRGMDVCEPGYAEGITVDTCGPQCAALALGRQAAVVSGVYENMSDSFIRLHDKVKEDE